MHIETFNESAELSVIRTTHLYTRLRPYVHERLASKNFLGNWQVWDEDEAHLSVEDRYFVKLDILLGQILKNCKTRQFWKRSMAKVLEDEAISCLSVEIIDRAYLAELVVLFERLGRIGVLLKKSFGSRINISELDEKLLAFFSPALFEKRNFSQHRLYIGFPGLSELELLERQAVDQESFRRFFEMFSSKVRERINWYSYTEESLAPLLFNFLELVDQKVREGDGFFEPTDLPVNFSISDRLKIKLRDPKRYNHQALYEAATSNKSQQRTR